MVAQSKELALWTMFRRLRIQLLHTSPAASLHCGHITYTCFRFDFEKVKRRIGNRPLGVDSSGLELVRSKLICCW